MANPLTMEVESKVGIAFVFLMAIFFSGVLFISIKNYTSDQIVLDASMVEVKSMTSTERQLIAQWIQGNNIEIPEGKGYNYITQQYPERPWINY